MWCIRKKNFFIIMLVCYGLGISPVWADKPGLSTYIVQNYQSVHPDINLQMQPRLAYVNTFVFNPKTRLWVAYGSNGKAVKSGIGSGGKSYCSDIKRSCRTPAGHFRVRFMNGAGCKSSRYPVGKGGAPMPYCTFYSKYYAVHGSYDVPNYNASHGCIRVKPAAAKWLYYNFFKIGTHVIVLPY